MSGPEREKQSPELQAALRALAAAERGSSAPPAVEARLLQAFREQRHVPRTAVAARPWRWVWAAAVAASLLLLAVVDWRRGSQSQPQGAPGMKVEPIPAAAAAVPPPETVVAERTRPRPRRVVRPARAQAVAPARDRDDNEFIPLPYAARIAPGEALDVVRVQVPRSTMMRFGLPVSADRPWEPVRADLIVGQDGLTRAIRFVR